MNMFIKLNQHVCITVSVYHHTTLRVYMATLIDVTNRTVRQLNIQTEKVTVAEE